MDLHRLLENAQSLLSEAQSSAHTTYDAATHRVLDRLGLQHKRTASDMILPALGILGAGVAAGAVLGLLFAPRRGEEMRGEVVHRLEDLRERIQRTEDAQIASDARQAKASAE